MGIEGGEGKRGKACAGSPAVQSLDPPACFECGDYVQVSTNWGCSLLKLPSMRSPWQLNNSNPSKEGSTIVSNFVLIEELELQ